MALLSWSHAAIQGTIITIRCTVLTVTWGVWWPGEAVPVLNSSPCQCRVRTAPADWEMCGVSLMSNADSGAGRRNEAARTGEYSVEIIQPRYYSRLPSAAVIYEVFVVSDIGPIS